MRDMTDHTAAHTRAAPAALRIDEGTRPELVEFGAANLSATNVRQEERGAASVRNGFAALSTVRLDATSATVGYKLLADRNTLCRITEDPGIEAYSSSAARWKALGRVPNAGVKLIDLPSMGTAATLEDVEVCNGYVAAAWLSGTTAYAAVIDGATGALVRAAEAVATLNAASPPLLTYAGNKIFLLAYDAANTLSPWYLDTTSAATISTGWVTMASLAADVSAISSRPYAVCNVGAKCALFYANTSAGTDRATLVTFDSTGALATSAVGTNSTTPALVDVDGEAGTTIWLAWNEGTATKVAGRDATTIATVNASAATMITTAGTPTRLAVAQNDTAPTKARVWVNELPAGALTAQMRGVQTSGGAAAADGSAIAVPAAQMNGKPFMYSGRYYALFFGVDSTNTQDNLILCDWSADVTYLRPVATFAPGLSTESTYGKVKARQYASTARYYTGLGIKRSGVADGFALAELDFASTKRWLTAAHGNSLYLSGGLLSYFDGQRVAEAGFLLRPKTPTVTKAGAAGPNGTFTYVCVYEEVDADGNWHQSGVSGVSASIAPATETVTITTTPLSITARAGGTAGARSVRVAFYRSAAGGAAPYYRLGTTINDTSASTVTYADSTVDATSGAKLYSQPGVIGTAQDRRPPPYVNALVSYNGMLVGASGSDVWYSGQDVSGEGAWFNPIFQIPVPGDGDITALWVQDGTLFAAKRRNIYALGGEAPSDNGASGGLGLPRLVSVDTGCTEARTTCTTNIGTFFQSDRGIELLTRAQTVEWIGADVQDTVSTYSVCSSITVEPVSNTVLVELSNDTSSPWLMTGTGRTLVYDLSLRAWVSADRRTSTGGTADKPSQSACMAYTGSAYRYCWVDAAGSVQYETPGTYTHADGTFIVPTIETAWLKHGLQQEQTVWAGTVLYERHTAAALKVEVAYDYGAYSSADDKTWTEANVVSGVRQLEFRPKPRGEAMKFRVTATAPATVGTGQGLTFIGLSFDLAPRQGATKGTYRPNPALRK